MNIVILTGSNREHSSSAKLCRLLAGQLEGKGCTVELFDLYRQPLPMYCPDVDEYDDTNVLDLLRSFEAADAIVLSSPEYHGGVTGVFKNALDYLEKGHFSGKPVLAVSSSGGAVGTSTLQQIQSMVRYVHGVNCPEWISIGGDARKFDANGELIDPKVKQRIARALDVFLRMTQKPGTA